MRTADLILSHGVLVPSGRRREHPPEVVESLQHGVSLSTIVEVTNVYEYCRQDAETEWDPYDLPCAAPPEDMLFLDYRQHNDKRMGLQGHVSHGPFVLLGLTPAEGGQGANGYQELVAPEGKGTWPSLWVSDNLPSQSAWDNVRWVWAIDVFQEHEREVYGPLSLMKAALDKWGRLLDVTYKPYIPCESHEEAQRLTFHPFLVFITAVNFMQCANIETVYVDPPAKLSRNHVRKGRLNRPMVRYKVLKLRMKGPATRNRGQKGQGSSGLVDFHTVRGEFHHYGDCCPGQHPPKGLAFGKLTGRFWVPGHARGNPERGMVVKDYEIVPAEEPDAPPASG